MTDLIREPYDRARRLFIEGKADEAFGAYKSLAEAGDSQCQVFVGWMLHTEYGVPQNKELAIAWFERAATLGSGDGAFYCGRSTFQRADYATGLRWFQQAAEQEFGPALLWLGFAYLRGLGVAVDRPKGIRYLERAAETGNFFARRELALMMIRGEFGISKIPMGLVLFPSWLMVAISDGLGQPHPQSDKVMG
jgi:TPR repeat protein